MASFIRFSFEKLLPFFSWTRQRDMQRRCFLQLQVMSTTKDKLPTVAKLITCKDEDPHELSYTSLWDLLSTNRPASPITPKRENPYEDIEEDERPVIKNCLVELAARAYLLPSHAQATLQTSSSPGSGRGFLERIVSRDIIPKFPYLAMFPASLARSGLTSLGLSAPCSRLAASGHNLSYSADQLTGLSDCKA